MRKKTDHKFGNTEQNFSPLNLSKGSQTPIWAIGRREPFFATRWNASEFLTEGSYGIEHKISKVMKEVYCDLKIIINGLYGMDFIRQSPKGISEYGNPGLPALNFHDLSVRECNPEQNILFLTVPVVEHKN